MKRAGLVLAMFALSAWAGAVLVDDFSSYSPGDVDTMTSGAWVESPTNTTTATMTIAVDPTNASNKVLSVQNNGAQIGVYGALSGSEIVTNNTTKTMFVMFYLTNTAYDTSFGLTTNDTPNQFGNFNVQCAVVNGTFRVRNAGTTTTVGPALTANTWYYVWAVINNTNNTYSVYLKTAASDATSTDLVATNYAFRTVSGTLNPDGDMDRFLAFTNYGASGGVSYSATALLLDNITIRDGADLTIPPMLYPYNPSVTQVQNGTTVSATLNWKAASDPAGLYTVNPNIVDQYVFVGSGTDPNMYYKGATGTDPGTTTPDSQFLFNGAYDTSYRWAVVEALTSHTQSLTVGVSTLTNVDPNNIKGSTWTFVSLSSVPTITQEPADARAFVTDPNASFTVGFTSVNTATATWYKNGTAITPDGSKLKVTTKAASSTLEITNPTDSDEGKYYCVLSNQAGTADDKQTATRLLVIKKTLAQFNFEQNLADTSGNSAPAGIMKTVTLADPNEEKATVVAAATYVTGIQGYAISLDGTQFVDFGTGGYPKAGPLDTLGDIRGAGYEKTGFGRGMEQGSILCWIKLASVGAVYMNANGSDDTHFGLTSGGTNNARMIVRGRNYDNSYQELGTAAGGLNMTNFSLQDGQWHMFAATWDDSGVRIYINGELLAANSAGVPEKYIAWERANIMGASRTAGTRQILNSLLTGAIDSMRVYNYVVSTDTIATEYEALSGKTPCANHSFAGNVYNFDNSASSYCKIDLGDFMVFAQNWLLNGLYAQ